MKILRTAAVAVMGLGIVACGDVSSEVSDAIAEYSAYDSTDLSCAFDSITGADEVEDEYAETTDEDTCEEASDQFAMILDEYDTDGDYELSDDELAEAEEDFEAARLAEMDTDGNGEISDAEKDAWRANKLPARKEKREDHFKGVCEDLGKTAEECRGFRDEHKDHHREDIEARKDEFDLDNDGELSKEENEAMREALHAEREERREDFVKEHDQDGDGKIGEGEREQRREKRKEDVEANRPPPGGGGEGGQGGEGNKPKK